MYYNNNFSGDLNKTMVVNNGQGQGLFGCNQRSYNNSYGSNNNKPGYYGGGNRNNVSMEDYNYNNRHNSFSQRYETKTNNRANRKG